MNRHIWSKTPSPEAVAFLCFHSLGFKGSPCNKGLKMIKLWVKVTSAQMQGKPGFAWFIFLYLYKHIYMHTHTAVKCLKLWKALKKKESCRFSNPKTSPRKVGWSCNRGSSPQAGHTFLPPSPARLPEGTLEWRGRYSSQPLASADFRCFAGAHVLFFWTGSNPKILNPNSPRAQPPDSQGQNDYLRSPETEQGRKQLWEGKGREGWLAESDFPSASKEYKLLTGLRQWFVAG